MSLNLKLLNILGLSYYRYTLSSNNYNINTGSSVTITVNVQNVLGANIPNKEVQLYLNGTSLGNSYKSTTNSNGNVTFTYTCNNEGLNTFSVQNKSIGILVGKQDKLVSGTTLKTINSQTLLGSGDITVSGGSNVDIVTNTNGWNSTTSDSRVPSEKLVKNSLDEKISKTSTDGGFLKSDGSVDSSSYLTTGSASSTYVAKESGKGLFSGSYSDLTNKPSYTATITSSTENSYKLGTININGSDVDIYGKDTDTHQSLSNYVQKSQTGGLLKNDGSVDTSSYITSSSLPSASSTTPSADTNNGSYGSGTSYARSNHTHPKSSLYAESSHTHTYSNISNVTTVDVTVTYTDNSTETIKLLKYTGS